MRLPWLGDVGSYVFLCLISLAIFDVKTVVRVRIKNYNKVFKMPYCAIKWCGKSSKTSSLSKDGITFHRFSRFPKCPKIKLKWMEATKREDNWFPGRNNFICSQHFTGDSFRHGNRRILLANAVPTQMLPTLTSQYPEALNSSTSETKDKESYALTTAIQPCSDIYIANIHKQTMDKLELVSSNKSFGGHQKVYSHESSELQCKINFSIYLPPQAEGGDVKLPVIFYLSGLTCNEQNFIGKSGFQRVAAEHGIIVVGPDTSPRGVKIPGDDESWDFGVAAGFYLDATKEPWSKNYRMGSYVNKELYDLILSAFNNIVDPDRIGIMGHSMGGHGALVSTLRNPGLYKSVSAFAPICNPSSCPWGVKAFTGYLGDDRKQWSEWDATELVKGYDGPPLTLFIDQGTEDKFYKEKQLLPENLVEACRSVGVPIIFNLRDGYDHSYYYISTYIKEHFDFHAKILKA